VSPSATRQRPVARLRSRLGGARRPLAGDRAASALARGALPAVVVAGSVLRCWGLGRQGLWYDEAVTSWLLRGTPRQLLAALPHSESTPPLYYLVAWGWVRAVGDTAAGRRALSALAGTATIAVAFAAGRSLAGRRVGLVAAILVAVNPLLVWYSQEARSYALLVLVTATSLWLCARVVARPQRRRLLAWAGASAIALATHYFAVFAVAPQAVVVLAQRRAALRDRLLAVGLVGLAGASLLVLALAQRKHRYWFIGRPLAFRTEQIVRQFLVGFRPPATRPAELVAASAVAVGGVALALRGSRRERRAAAVAGGVGLAAVALPLALALAGTDLVNTRNVIGALVPLAVAVACGLGARRARVAGSVATVVLVGVSLWALVALARDPLGQRPRWGAVAAALGPARAPRLILLEGTSTWARPLSLLLPHTWWLGRRGASVREVDVVRRPGRRRCPEATWWGPFCDLRPSPALIAPGRGMRLVWRRDVAGFEVARFRSQRPVRFTQRFSRHRRLLLTPTRQPLVP